MALQFEWDWRKARANASKHKVTFQEAVSVFRDPLADVFDDEDHSAAEKREIIIGHSDRQRLLVISFVERLEGVIRIISARGATRREQHDYEEEPAP